jgi:sulfhydrogenase subunit beta (sulfur reductase)
MTEVYIEKAKFPGVVGKLMDQYRVFGPVFQGQYHEFVQLQSGDEIDLGYQNTRLSPKGLFHPHSERMFEFSLAKDDPDAGIVKEVPKDYSPRVILGIRPCDAMAFRLDDANFDTTAFQDPWWTMRRKATTLVGLACNQPCRSCFCTSVGTGPFDPSGLDALLIDVDGGFLFQAVTEKGEQLVNGLSQGEPVSAAAREKAEELKRDAETDLTVQFDPKAIAQNDLLELFNASFWDEVQFSCINCGTCTFLCPTCWCFDIQDEIHETQGDRIRIWDSCMFPLFTMHGSGHNPRNQKLQRVRQRFMHKLKYYPDKYRGGVACVGCGRCVKFCPVNIDIREVARQLSAACVCPA